jgi:hypothetical protein
MVNDHQLVFARALAEPERAVFVENLERLEETIAEALSLGPVPRRDIGGVLSFAW